MALWPALMVVVAAAPLKVGVTLHPYASWAWQVTKGLPVEVVPVVPGDVDIGSYQPRPQDVATLATLDVLLVNGLGHDSFIDELLKASGNTRCVLVNLNEATPLLTTRADEGPNAHTFLSLGNAMAQSFTLARALAQVRPEWRATLEDNASAYSRRLRALRTSTVVRLRGLTERRVITVHDGYSYLLQDLGLQLVAVVEPSHGLLPTPTELGHIVELLQQHRARVVVSEVSFPKAMEAVLREAGATVVVGSHIATGSFTPERFEEELALTLDALVRALGR